MAFNHNYQVEYARRVSLDNNPLDASSSILSDSQSLWVLFNPSVQMQIAHESDILSFSNNTRTETDTESMYGSISALQDSQGNSILHQDSEARTELDIAGEGSNIRRIGRDRMDPQSESDSLIDHFAGSEVGGEFQGKGVARKTRERQSRLFETPGSELRSRINKWRDNNLDEMVDDNTASWDLDEDLSLHLGPSDGERERHFYGDEVFGRLSQQEYIKFKNVERNLRQSLESQNNQSYLPFIINQILYKLAHSSQHLVEQQSIGTLKQELQKYSSLLRENSTQPFLDSLIEAHLRNSHVMHVANTKRSISDTTSASSLILCGGSWNEL